MRTQYKSPFIFCLGSISVVREDIKGSMKKRVVNVFLETKKKKKNEENLLFQSSTTTFSFISEFCYLEDYADMPYWSTCRRMESKV
jgi:hypothetical protein